MIDTAENEATCASVKSDMPAKPRLLDQVRERIRVLHYSRSTEKTYTHWIADYIRHHHMRHPSEMGGAEVEAYLSHLATARDVAAGTQNQAMHAILFLYKQVLGVELPWLDSITRARESKRIPTVLTQSETRALLANADGLPGLVIRLLYGTGMRLMEGLRLRVKDVDFPGRRIIVRAGKGDKDRVVPLPETLVAPLQARIAERRRMHDIDLARGRADVYLPHALARKYPNASREFGWQYLFAAAEYSADPETGVIRRHHLHPKTIPGMPPEQEQRRQFASAHNIRMAQALDEKFRAAMAGRGPMTVAEIAKAIDKTHRQAASSILRAEARGRVRRVGDRASGVTYEWIEGSAA